MEGPMLLPGSLHSFADADIVVRVSGMEATVLKNRDAADITLVWNTETATLTSTTERTP